MTLRNVGLTVAALLVLAGGAGAEDFGILNQYEPEEGVLFGGQPTAEQVEAMAEAGVKTVIDLRGETEGRGYDEVAVMAAAGLRYVPIPVTGETMLEASTFETFLEVFTTAEKPLLVHCASGNRVGALYYAYLVAEKEMSRDDALEAAKANGLRSEALIEPVDAWLAGRPSAH